MQSITLFLILHFCEEVKSLKRNGCGLLILFLYQFIHYFFTIVFRSKVIMKGSSIANNGSTSYIIIHVCPTNSSKQQRRQTKEPDPVTKCSKCDGSLKLQHLTDTRSTQVFPYDLDPGNYSHPKNQSK